VRYNGLLLSRHTGANTRIVELFAFLHDTQRQHDWDDPQHGARAARFAATLQGDCFRLSSQELSLLQEACRNHSDGYLEADITIQTCWDADRLDLGRVGVKPVAKYLCTEVARDPEILEPAYKRSLTAW
jgi:uncharacterized protein